MNVPPLWIQTVTARVPEPARASPERVPPEQVQPEQPPERVQPEQVPERRPVRD
jgi:hypothetical protein